MSHELGSGFSPLSGRHHPYMCHPERQAMKDPQSEGYFRNIWELWTFRVHVCSSEVKWSVVR